MNLESVFDAIIKVGAVAAAAGGLGALLIKLFKWAMAPQKLSKRIADLEAKEAADKKALKEKEEADRKEIQSENALIVFGLSACLDGLMQLGVNHSVPKAKDELDKFLNRRAHD